MEIEVKFLVPDEATFERLARLERLCGYALSPAQVKQVHDVYLDTADYALLRGGYACRVRRKEGGAALLALKSLSPAQGALHVREEFETALPVGFADQMVFAAAAWPAGPAATLLLGLAQGEPLGPLFDLHQQRLVRLLLHPAARPLVEISLDRVRYAAAAEEQLGLEAELLAEDAATVLEQVAVELQSGWRLRPETRSKFEQGLALAHRE